jgi:hypothetical protein
MPAFIFTFGSDHVHPITGDSLGRRFVKIEAEDSEAGIEKYELRELSRENPL